MKLDSCFDIDYVDNNIIVVTSGTNIVAQYISPVDIEKRKLVIKLHLVEYIEGAVHTHDGILIYCTGENGLKTINLLNGGTKGSVRSGPLNQRGFSYVAVFNKDIMYTNSLLNTIKCCDFQFMKQWEFRNERVLRDPHGISVDNAENVYVVGTYSNTVVVVSHDRKHHRQSYRPAKVLSNHRHCIMTSQQTLY